MIKTIELTESDRNFFGLVSKAAFCNPFSEQRDELNSMISGIVGGGEREKVLEIAIKKVLDRIEGLQKKGVARLCAYSGEDNELMRSVFMFEAFHLYMNDFDLLIQRQTKEGDVPCPVPFAHEAIKLLIRRGFPKDEAIRYFALLYQLRRAFFFINRGLIGNSQSVRALRLRLWNNVFTNDIVLYSRFLWCRMEDFSTVLLGETGSGKGMAAGAIGRSGFIPFDEKKGCFVESFARNFISINLSQYPESLIESELFGHKKGAFTGAVEHHEGVFSKCSPHGAIFLDEIGDASVPVQIKLLQVLQDRTFSKVGSHEKERFSGRVIAATNHSLDDLRRDGRFRNDFYYRLCSDVIKVPSLQERIAEDPNELPLLLSNLIFRMTGQNLSELVDAVQTSLKRKPGANYPWPGNVRELEQAARRIILNREYEGDARICASSFKDKLIEGVTSGDMDAMELIASYCALLYQRHQTYEEVARRTKLDRRTAKKHILKGLGNY